MPSTDELGDFQTILVESAIEKGLAVFEGHIDVAHGNPARGGPIIAAFSGEVDDFVRLAHQAKARMIYVDVERFEFDHKLLEQIDDVSRLLAAEDDDAASGASSDSVKEGIHRWAQHDGHVIALKSMWTSDGVCHMLECEVEWYRDYDDAVDLLSKETVDSEFAKHMEERLAELRVVRERAAALASHPRFFEATSEPKRQFMAEQLFPDLNSEAWERIGSRAGLIHWWSVGPGDHLNRSARVRELYTSGKSIPAIAGGLGLSRDTVRALLADSDENRQASLL